MKKKINLKFFTIILFIILLFFSEIFSLKIPFLKYTDEIICVIGAFYIILHVILHRKKIEKSDFKILMVLLLLITIGIFGNIINDIEKNIYYIIIDIVSTIKALITYVFVRNYLTKETAKQVTKSLLNFSKAFIILAAVFSVLSQVLNINMTGQERFGIKGYIFIFQQTQALVVFLISFLLFIAINSEDNKRIIIKYTILTIISLIMTTKGPSIIWSAIIILLFMYYAKNKKMSNSFIILLFIFCAFLGQYQIKNYFMNENAPRALFYKYGVITAYRYKPIGAGFASFGSEAAKDDYSKLYVKYGFNNLFGMNKEEGWFLNDNYWPTILGEFGFIGTILMLYIYYYLFKRFQLLNCNRYVKAILINNYIYMLIHSLGSSLMTSVEGVILFLMFGICTKIYEDRKLKDENINIKN